MAKPYQVLQVKKAIENKLRVLRGDNLFNFVTGKKNGLEKFQTI